MLSSFVGVIIGDLAWLEGLRLLGATRVLIIDSIKPFVAAIMGLIFLGEPVSSILIFGAFITLIGILVVRLVRESDEIRELPYIYDDFITKEETEIYKDFGVLELC